MTLLEFLQLHPDFTIETLYKLVEKVGIGNIVALYSNIDQDHQRMVNDLYQHIVYSYFSVYWIIKLLVIYQIKMFILLVFVGFLSAYIQDKELGEIQAYYHNMLCSLATKYSYTEVFFIYKELISKNDDIAKDFLDMFITYLFVKIKDDEHFLLILHKLLEESFL